eukprot:833464-Heterocapsa_arctica.AAC.1
MGRVRRDLGFRPCAGGHIYASTKFEWAQKQTGWCTGSIGGMGKREFLCQNGEEENYSRANG